MLTHSFSHIGNRYWWISPLHYKGFTPNSPSAMLGALESGRLTQPPTTGWRSRYHARLRPRSGVCRPELPASRCCPSRFDIHPLG